MLRVLLLLLAISPLWLAYTFGFGVLLAFAALAAATFLFSTGKAQGSEANQGGLLTGYHTTRFVDF
jgi:hypothetical protein